VKFLNGNTMSTQETAQEVANMSVVHNILNGSDDLVAPVATVKLAMAA